MILRPPFTISARLLPALKIGNAYIQLEYSRIPGAGGRTRYQWTIDLENGESFQGHDLQSGCQGGDLIEGFKSLLSFLGAFGESVAYETRTGIDGENAGLFPAGLKDWASSNRDEFSMLEFDLEECPEVLQEVA